MVSDDEVILFDPMPTQRSGKEIVVYNGSETHDPTLWHPASLKGQSAGLATYDNDMQQDSDAENHPYLDFNTRYAAHRLLLNESRLLYPELDIPLKPLYSHRFVSPAASLRYESLSTKNFIDQKFLRYGYDKNLEAQSMIESAGLIHTVLGVDVDLFIREAVWEFYANLLEMETRENGINLVYVHGKLIVLTPSIISRMFFIENS